MSGRQLGDSVPAVALQAAKRGSSEDGATPQRHDTEIRRMAAFRIREAANRIATLANSAQNETLRHELLSICQRLVNEERALLDADVPRPKR